MSAPDPPTTAYVALGSNLGNRLEHLRRAARELADHPRLELVRKSRVYETDPVGGPAGQDPYLNAVVRLEARASARELLAFLLEVERRHGRERRERWGPRTLDLDLLVFGREAIAEPDLGVPHPRAGERAFVLAPLAELDPALKAPGWEFTAAELLSRSDRSGVRLTDLRF